MLLIALTAMFFGVVPVVLMPPGCWVARARGLAGTDPDSAGDNRVFATVHAEGMTWTTVSALMAQRRFRAIALVMLTITAIVYVQTKPQLIVATGLVVLAATVMRIVAQRHRQHQKAERQLVVASAIEVLTDGLRAGLTPAGALYHADSSTRVMLAPIRAAIQMGENVPAAFVRAGQQPGAEALSAVGSAWNVAESCGAPLSQVLARLTDHLQHARDTQRQVAAGVSPARATAQLMAVLPLFGVVIGRGMGTDPIVVITDSVAGASCLLVGIVFACSGLLWVERIADRAQADR